MPLIWERMLLNCHFRFGMFENLSMCLLLLQSLVYYRQPFDWKSPMGYLVVFVEQYIMVQNLYMVASVAVALEIGCYLLMMASIEDIKNEVGSINGIAKSVKNHPELSQRLHESIRFHVHVKQLSEFPSV